MHPMPPQTIFSREKILNATVELIQKKGLGAVSARSIAAEIGSSTAPIYSYFPRMEELHRDVTVMLAKKLTVYMEKEYTSIRFLNMGIGMTIFARENPNYYEALFMTSNRLRDVFREIDDMGDATLINYDNPIFQNP